MGCEVSVPVESGLKGAAHKINPIGKTERKPRSTVQAVGQTERFLHTKKNSSKPMVSSNNSHSSKGGNPGTVSLEVDEEITNEIPATDQFGHLMPEEVVRRTSSSLSVSNITVGNKQRGVQELNITVSIFLQLAGTCQLDLRSHQF